MPSLLHLGLVWLHLIAAVVWLGGLIFQLCVVFPSLTRLPSGEAARFGLSLEARFRAVMWPAVGLALFTGLVNLVHTWYAMSTIGMQVSTTFSWVLSGKVFLIAVMLVLQAIQQFVLQPRRLLALHGASTQGAAAQMAHLQRVAALLYSGVIVLGLVVLFCGVLLRTV